VDYEDVVRRIEQEGARRVKSEDWRPEETPVEGWEEFRVTDRQDQAIRRRFHAVDRQLGRRGVRYMFGKNMDEPEWSLVRIHPGARDWTRARCSTASSVPRPEPGGCDPRGARCEAARQEAACRDRLPRLLSTGGTTCAVCFATTGSR
jgi:hypothetical protein